MNKYDTNRYYYLLQSKDYTNTYICYAISSYIRLQRLYLHLKVDFTYSVDRRDFSSFKAENVKDKNIRGLATGPYRVSV